MTQKEEPRQEWWDRRKAQIVQKPMVENDN